MPSPLFCIAVFVISASLYLLFAGQLSTTELIAGSCVAVGFTCLQTVLRLREERQLSLPMPPLRVILGPIAALMLDAGRVGQVLVRAILRRPLSSVGTISRQPFRQGAGSQDRGREALVFLATSLAPNGYALERRPDDGGLLMHRLAPTRPNSDAEWPT